MQLLSGKAVRESLESKLSSQVEALKQKGISPRLDVIRVGDNPESASYVKAKITTAEKLGISSEDHHLTTDTTQETLEALILQLNKDPEVNGILCQLPLPKHLEEQRVVELIDPKKDVDCFHPENFGMMARGTPRFLPCTPAGIMAMLAHYELPVSGKHVVVIGRSNIVGRPISLLMSLKGTDATVTVVHSRTPDLKSFSLQADILVVAIGGPERITADMVKEGAVVVDVGVNRVEDATRPRGYRLVGDVAFEAVSAKASAITPVPGGVGPMTVIMLMQNTLMAAQLQYN